VCKHAGPSDCGRYEISTLGRARLQLVADSGLCTNCAHSASLEPVTCMLRCKLLEKRQCKHPCATTMRICNSTLVNSHNPIHLLRMRADCCNHRGLQLPCSLQFRSATGMEACVHNCCCVWAKILKHPLICRLPVVAGPMPAGRPETRQPCCTYQLHTPPPSMQQTWPALRVLT
jgi:hypothetical protein